MLSIRDEQVRTLAQDVMRKTGAPTITAAIRQALENEIARADEKVPLRERVEALRRKVLGDAVHPKGKPLTKEERDALWER
jgi:antitoxin VapB